MTAPLVSVIIPYYNMGKYIQETIDSVLKSTYKNYEIIIVNDGSTDVHTINILKRLNHNKVRLINKANGGLVSARNVGVENCRGDIILPLDADDKISSTYMQEAVEILLENDEVKLVYSRVMAFDGKVGEIELPFAEMTIDSLLSHSLIFPPAFFWKKDFYKVGGWNPNMNYNFEDWEFWIALLKHGGQAYKIPEIHLYYRIRPDSITGIRTDQGKLREMVHQIYLNHLDYYAANFPDPINLYHDYKNIKFRLESRVNGILKSPEYKIGYYLLRPYRVLRRWIFGSE